MPLGTLGQPYQPAIRAQRQEHAPVSIEGVSPFESQSYVELLGQLEIDEEYMDEWSENLRQWLAERVFQPLVQRMARLNTELERANLQYFALNGTFHYFPFSRPRTNYSLASFSPFFFFSSFLSFIVFPSQPNFYQTLAQVRGVSAASSFLFFFFFFFHSRSRLCVRLRILPGKGSTWKNMSPCRTRHESTSSTASKVGCFCKSKYLGKSLTQML